MKLKRRSFLGISIGGILSGPKVVAEKVAEQAGLGTIGAFGAGGDVFGGLIPGAESDEWGAKSAGDVSSYVAGQRKKLLNLQALQFLKPDWFEEKRRSRASEVYALDMDLAAMHSMSMAAKVAIQKERNYQRALLDDEKYINRRIQEKLFGGESD